MMLISMEESTRRMRKFVTNTAQSRAPQPHPDKEVTEAVITGLANHNTTLGRPLCPCRFYPDKEAEVKHRAWICACDDMQIYKYCHCLLFVNKEGLPITEYLPEDHEGRMIHGLVKDPTPDKGRPLREKTQEREKERKDRPS